MSLRPMRNSKWWLASALSIFSTSSSIAQDLVVLTEAAEPASEERLMALGHALLDRGEEDRAVEAFKTVAGSADPWFAWAGESAIVAAHRLTKNWSAAEAAVASLAGRFPDRAPLMLLWQGDTALLAERPEQAVELYRRAMAEAGDAIFQSEPLGALALRQIARAELARNDPAAAADAERELLRRYPTGANPEWTLAKALIFEAMAAGNVPREPISAWLHRAECSDSDPCVISHGLLLKQGVRGRDLANLAGLRFEVSALEEAQLSLASEARHQLAQKSAKALLACTVSTATDGFVYPRSNTSPGGYNFMSSIPQGYHPGIDINTAAGDGDCGVSFKAAARGCVTDSSPSNWGSATVQHSYTSRTWTSQYGHASSISYSSGAAVTKGATLGLIGKVGATSCHLHHELREQDHPSATNADYYSSLTQTNVGDWYQNPFPFEDAHRSYSWNSWIDEQSFVRTGTWTAIAGVGNEDDMRWGGTTATGSKTTYATYTFTPPTTATYEVWAFVPWNHGTSTGALYKVARTGSSTVFTKTVNQLALLDSWIRLGSGSLTGGVSYYIEVATNTGESSKRVALDDFLIIRP